VLKISVIQQVFFLSQLGLQNVALEKLLNVESDYWSTFIQVEGERLYPALDG
jgi:hypothetical protein